MLSISLLPPLPPSARPHNYSIATCGEITSFSAIPDLGSSWIGDLRPNLAPHAPKMVLLAGSGSRDDPEVVEVSSSSWVPSSRSKRKRSEGVPFDISEMNEVDPSDVIILGESTADKKNKQPIVEYAEDLHKLNNMPQSFIGSSTALPSDNGIYMGTLKSLEESYHYLEDDSDSSAYDYEEDIGDIYENSAYNIAAAFLHLDLPPGVEATVPWLQKPECKKTNRKPGATNQVERKPMLFKQFDVLQDSSDHYYDNGDKGKGIVKKPSMKWTKRIQHEWKVLEKDLPEMIFVRVYEERLDLLRAVIVGPAGTPYHDGLFFFDAFFPSNYPSVPPRVHYHSGGLRLNPNLYACGKVCLSLLGTWHGNGCERWNPDKSTMLQVLVSIQALVLNAKPYFNEPGFASSAGTCHGEKQSFSYNEQSFLLSCKTMLYTLRRPPKNFESFVAEHFQNCGRAILVACEAYMNGAQVGCVDADGVQDVDEGDMSSSLTFRDSLKRLFDELLLEFTVKGVDCNEFLASKADAGEVKRPDTTLRL